MRRPDEAPTTHILINILTFLTIGAAFKALGDALCAIDDDLADFGGPE